MLKDRRVNLSRELSQEKRKLQMLDDSSKAVILSFMEKVKNDIGCTEEQEQYFQNLKAFLNPKTDKGCSVEQIMNLEVHQLLARILMEYVFLQNKDFENWWYDYDCFVDISVSIRYVEEVRRHIKATCSEFGVEAIVNRFAKAEEEQYRCCLEEALESIRGLVLTEEQLNEFYRMNMDSISYFIKGQISFDSYLENFLTKEEFFEALMTLSEGKHSLKTVEAYIIE